jgi:hypothetical protein
MRNNADVAGGKSIVAVYTNRCLTALYKIHGKKRGGAIFFSPVYISSSSFYTYPTKRGRYNMFSSCCDKDSAFIFTASRLPDVNPP